MVLRASEVKCHLCGKNFKDGDVIVYIVVNDALEKVHLECAVRYLKKRVK